MKSEYDETKDSKNIVKVIDEVEKIDSKVLDSLNERVIFVRKISQF